MTSSYQNGGDHEEGGRLLRNDDDNDKNHQEGRQGKGRLMDCLVGVALGIFVMLLLRDPGPKKTAVPPAPFLAVHDSSSSNTILSQDNDKAVAKDSMNTAPPRYTKFQTMGFQIYTGGAPGTINGTMGNPECRGHNSYGHMEGVIQCYLGLDSVILDVERRLQIMTAAVETAYKVASKDDKETLKIFVAPEFFWRGVDGAYVMDRHFDRECTAICQILRGLESLVEQDRFEDWLFVTGTAIVSEDLPAEDKFDNLFYNFAPVYKGGPFRAGKRYLVPKRYTSNMDFLTPQRHFNDSLTKELLQFVPQTDGGQQQGQEQQASNRTVLNPFYELKRKHYDRRMWNDYNDEIEALGYTMIEYAWFILDGITMTLEICVDHDVKSALNVYLADAATPLNTTLIPQFDTCPDAETPVQLVPIPRHQAQISLVSSSGMEVTADSLVLAHGGVIFLQDGANNTESQMIWERDDCGTFVWRFYGGTEMVSRQVKMSQTEVVFEYQVHASMQEHDIVFGAGRNETVDDDESQSIDWKEALNGVFTATQYEPKIKVYPPMEIALIDVGGRQ